LATFQGTIQQWINLVTRQGDAQQRPSGRNVFSGIHRQKSVLRTTAIASDWAGGTATGASQLAWLESMPAKNSTLQPKKQNGRTSFETEAADTRKFHWSGLNFALAGGGKDIHRTGLPAGKR
jgi:hypothetical protein